MMDYLEGIRAERCTRGPDGRWLCAKCGTTPLGDEEFLCKACGEAAEEERVRAERECKQREWVERVHKQGDRATRDLPRWPHFESAQAFATAVKSAQLRSIAERWDPSKGSLLLLGPSGEGKTSCLARCFVRLRDRLVAARLENPRDEETRRNFDRLSGFEWVTASEICRALSQHPLGKGDEPELVSRAARATVLAIDELGPEPARYGGDLFDLIDRRATKSRPTVCTSGLTEAAFRERYGDAFVRRLTERGLGFLVDTHPKESQRRNVG